MSEQQLCVSCQHLEERVSRRWYWCEKQSDWTSLATSCDDYLPLLPTTGQRQAPPRGRERSQAPERSPASAALPPLRKRQGHR